ncbi:MAG TPA: hypothetical protein VF085_00650 [Solirubrobacterales bacterium]
MRRIAALSCVLAFTCTAPVARAEGVVPVEGKWHATTSAGLPISFEVSGDQLLNARFRFRWGFCGSFESALRGAVPIEPSGHWKYTDSRGPFAEGAFVAPDRAEGTVVAPSRQLPGCPETKATFVATPGEAPFERAEAVVRSNVRTGHLFASPRTMILARDGHFRLYSLQWHSFGEPVAHATGRAFLRRGCRDREVTRPHVSIFLNNLTQQGEYRVYLHLHYTIHGPVPRGFPQHGSRFLE